ncbi:MAG: hypothetical protein JNK82_26265 [Myxococcaceae bacterium]|nr:hypothetical protein [Myxococcaceae bacterium]
MNARGHLSSETIDLLLMSALSGDRQTEAKAHLDGCQLCQKRWSELNEDKARFEQFVFPRTLAKLEERLAAPTLMERLRAGWKMLVPASAAIVAASLAAAVFVGGGGKDRTQTEDDVYIGIKGGASLEVFANRPESNAFFTVKPGTVLKPKDKIRFVVNGAGSKYLLIASRDGSGAFTVYHPFGAAQSGQVTPGRVELPGSVELDEVTGSERLIAVFSDAPVPADAVKTALEQSPADPKIEKAKVVSWEFVKSK